MTNDEGDLGSKGKPTLQAYISLLDTSLFFPGYGEIYKLACIPIQDWDHSKNFVQWTKFYTKVETCSVLFVFSFSIILLTLFFR